MMERMVRDYIKRLDMEYLPVFAPYQPTAAQKRRLQDSVNIRWFDFVPGGTLQEVLPTFAIVITKAGGGTVNDCLASQVKHLEKSWVKYEWRNFHNDTKSGRKPEKSPFFAFISSINPNDLPRPLREHTAVSFDSADPTPALTQLSKFIVKP
jgi:hypothetical protein